jgi:hypothetical protein
MICIYTVHDSTAEYFLPPFMAPNDAVARRMFIGSLGDSFSFRADFGLYCVGEFDDATGRVTARDPVLVLSGHSIAASLDPRSASSESVQ